MSLELAAKHLASKGRGSDTMLVHMTPGEVKSLQAIAMANGGSLTINPQTGLPEAGFLSRMLPMIAGAALTATGVGAPMAALLVGGGTGLATGSLNKGLMAGLGAFGGAGLGQGLTALGTQELATQAALTGGGDAALQAVNAAQASPFSTMGKGLETMFSKTTAGASGLGAAVDAMGGPAKAIQYGLAGAAPSLMGAEGSAAPSTPSSAPHPALKFNPNPVTPTPQPDVPAYGDMGRNFGLEQRYFNPSYTPLASAASAMAPTTQMPFMAAAGGPVEDMSMRNDAEMMALNRSQMFAGGGISHLGDYSDGGRLLRGPGDGVSDSIPATIGAKQPARLADGEFVIPARIVSELGNGSTEAGARKLYAMMNRIKKKRRAAKDIAADTKADKELPA